MNPAAVLSVLVKAQGVAATNTKLRSVQSQLTQTEAAAASMGMGMQRTGARMVSAGSMLTRRLSLPLVALGVASAKFAVDFEQSMTLVHTQAGASAKEVEHLRGKVLDLARATEFTPTELAAGLFRIESQGFRGAKAMEALTTAAELSAVGQADMEQTTVALTAAVKSGIKGTENMRQTVASLNAAVGQSSMRLEDMVGALSTGILPAARVVGLSLTDVTSALALMTRVGMPANAAATRLRMTLSLMAAPTDAAKKALASIGLEQDDLAKEMRKPDGLLRAITMLREHLDELPKVKQAQVIAKAFGGGRTSAAIQALIQDVDQLGDIYVETRKNASNFSKAVEKQAETNAAKLRVAWSAVQGTLIQIGQQVLPAIVPVLGEAAQMIGTIGDVFDALPEPMRRAIIVFGAFLAVLGPLMVIFGTLITAGGKIITFFATLRATLLAHIAPTQAAAAANFELAASAQAAATAQSQLLIANRSGAVVGSVPVGAGAAAAQTSAKATAMGFASSLARFLPIMLAAVGITSILSSVLSGDGKSAAFKSGGAIAGGIAGGLAFGLPGALAGAGIGSILGGFLGDLFGSSETLTPMQKALAASSKQMASALQREREGYAGLSAASKQIENARARQRKATATARQAEQNLQKVRGQHPANAAPVIKSELRLANAKDRESRATINARNAERVHGVELKLLKSILPGTVKAEKSRVQTLQQQQRRLLKAASSMDQFNSKEEERRDMLKALRRSSNQLTQAQEAYNNTIDRARRDISPQFARQLQNVQSIQAENARALNRATRQTRRNFEGWWRFSNSGFRNFGNNASRSNQRVRRSYEDLEGVAGPFLRESRSDLRKTGNAYKDMSQAGREGLNRLGTKTNNFLRALGVAKVDFSVAGRQRGGIIGGAGTGDKVPIMAEPGEGFINKTAVKAMGGPSAINWINDKFSRWSGKQVGGMVDPAGPGHGVVNRAIAGVVGRWSQRYNAAINYGYDPGGGHVSPGHNVTGTATDTGPAAGWAVGTPLFERGLRAIEGKVDQILYGTEGIGTPYPNHGRGNHAHIEWGMHPEVQGIVGSMLKRLMMRGPGPLRQGGQAVLDRARKAANQYLQKAVGRSGGGDFRTFAGEGTLGKSQLMNLWRSTNSFGDANLMAAIALAESGGRPGVTNEIGARGLYQIIPSTAAAFGLNYGRLTDAGYNTFGAGKILRGQGLGAWDAYTNGAYTQFLQKGGIAGASRFRTFDNDVVAAAAKKQGKGNLFKGPLNLLKKKPGKGRAAVRKLKRRFAGVGLNPKVLERLGALTGTADKWGEFAEYAQRGDVYDEETGIPTRGKFRGRTEAQYKNDQMRSLLGLRNQAIIAYRQVIKRQNRVRKFLREAKNRWRQVRKSIAAAQRKKGRLERKARQISRERRQLERQMSKLRSAKKPNRAAIRATRGKLKANAKQGQKVARRIRGVERGIGIKERVKSALEDQLIPTLDTQFSDLKDTKANLLGTGGSVGNVDFHGLQTIQGSGGSLDLIHKVENTKRLGGEIFNIHRRLEEIAAEAKGTGSGTTDGTDRVDERLALTQELLRQANQRAAISDAALPVLRQFDSLRGGFAGYFATGGKIPAGMYGVAGELGKAEIIEGPATVHSPSRSADMMSGGSGDLIIEEMNVYADEGRVTGRMNGREFDARVEKVVRRTTKPGRSTSGGRNR